MLKFDYRVVDTTSLSPGAVEAQLKMAGASGWRLAFVLPNGRIVLELMGEDDASAAERAPAAAPQPAVERISVSGEGFDEYLCGDGCGEVLAIPEKFRARIVADKLTPFKAGHGPHPEERQTYLAAPQSK